MNFLLEISLLFIISTVVFDILHFCLHTWKNSQLAILRRFSLWHDYHHKFLDEKMNIEQKWRWKNTLYHMFPEYMISILGTLLGLFFFQIETVITCIIIHTAFFTLRLFGKGEDINHKNIKRISSKHPNLFVSPTYHFKHHIFPNHFFSSFVGFFDFFIGKLCPIKNRKFLITGANGAFGKAMKDQIENMGGIVQTVQFKKDYNFDDYSIFDKILPNTDILILAHGKKYGDTMQSNHDSCVRIIDKFISYSKDRLVPGEVWAIGSEIEIHGDFGMNSLKSYNQSKKKFSKAAKKYFVSNDITFRYIVPSAFASSMGWGIMSGKFAARYALFLIKRGFYYIPVTYTGLAYLNYIRFRLIKI